MNEQTVIKVAAITGGPKSPAARFRVRQYIPLLADHGIIVREHIPFLHEDCGLPSVLKAMSQISGVIATRKADISWIGRELAQGYETFERFLKKPRVMDVDDSIWLDWPFGKSAIPHIAKMMDVIVAGNSYLADWFSRYCKNIYVLPTALDLSRYTKRTDSAVVEKKNFTIGWTGLACNFRYLKLIEQTLMRFLQNHPDADMLIVAERPWRSSLIPPEKIRFVKWNEQIEVSVLKEMSVGLMPLPDDEWTRGKCSFKMLQYMAVGLPVAVSPVGMNKEILAKGKPGFAATTPNEWYDAMEMLYRDQELQIKLGNAGRSIVEEHFSAAKIADSLAGIFRGLI